MVFPYVSRTLQNNTPVLQGSDSRKRAERAWFPAAPQLCDGQGRFVSFSSFALLDQGTDGLEQLSTARHRSKLEQVFSASRTIWISLKRSAKKSLKECWKPHFVPLAQQTNKGWSKKTPLKPESGGKALNKTDMPSKGLLTNPTAYCTNRSHVPKSECHLQMKVQLLHNVHQTIPTVTNSKRRQQNQNANCRERSQRPNQIALQLL